MILSQLTCINFNYNLPKIQVYEVQLLNSVKDTAPQLKHYCHATTLRRWLSLKLKAL